MTTSTGALAASHDYFPYGFEATTSSDTERVRFTGHERDLRAPGGTDDLDYMHARYYNYHQGCCQ
jgi:hypothetical protein